MMRKIRMLVFPLAVFFLSGILVACSGQKMEGLSSEQETGQSQTAGIQGGTGDGKPADGEAENAKSTVGGVKLYQYGDEVLTGNPAKSNWNIYSYCVRKAETFQTLQDAGIQIEDLYSTKAKINGKISETCAADGTLTEGFGVLLLDIQVKAVSVPLNGRTMWWLSKWHGTHAVCSAFLV